MAGIIKYNRYYSLKIDFLSSLTGQPGDSVPTGDSLTYTLPLTIEFETEHNSFASVNNLSLRIYNLNPDDRNKLRKNQLDWSHGMLITLDAGYENYHKVIFQGICSEAWSERDGTDFVTYIECFDGGFAVMGATYSGTFAAGTSRNTIIDTMMNSLGVYNVQYGARSNYQGSLGKDTSYSGFTTKLLDQETGGGFFIHNGNAYALQAGDALQQSTLVINAQTGLLNTPKYQQTYLDVEMLFEPSVTMAELVNLQSLSAANYSTVSPETQYIVKSISHRVTISPVVSGEAITSLGLLTGNFNVLK